MTGILEMFRDLSEPDFYDVSAQLELWAWRMRRHDREYQRRRRATRKADDLAWQRGRWARKREDAAWMERRRASNREAAARYKAKKRAAARAA